MRHVVLLFLHAADTGHSLINPALRVIITFVAVFILSPAYGQNVLFLSIDDYPRYGTEIKPAQREELRRVATGITGALVTGAEVNVSVIGHADFDAKGRDFEIDVSLKRASGAQVVLENLVKEESAKVGLPDSRLQSVHYNPLGLGTSRPIFSPPTTEKERMANRRVDFTFVVVPPLPVVSENSFTRCVKVLTGGTPPGPVRRMTCACNKFLQHSPRVQDSNYDFRARQRLPALANLSAQDLAVAVSSMVLHMRQDIRGTADASRSDFEFASGLKSIDDTVGRNINDFASQMNAGAATSVFDRLVLADIQARMSDPNHVYSCYAGYSRRNHDQ
ncbi:MAG TPA: hypothetical protein PLO50_06865 [Nitrospira sp.]|nr:hypothetical protein [Nitrospira sp.]